MRKPIGPITFTLKRRPQSARHGDERGRVWFHKYGVFGNMRSHAPKFKRTLKFNF